VLHTIDQIEIAILNKTPDVPEVTMVPNAEIAFYGSGAWAKSPQLRLAVRGESYICHTTMELVDWHKHMRYQ
jgi:hypothetical protein